MLLITIQKQGKYYLICIDQEKVDFDAQFDGINVLVTSEIDMSDERIE